MKAIQFFKVDMMRSKVQLKYMLLFSLIAFLLSVNMKGGTWFSFCYMIFCGVILSGQPFLMDQMSESGFLNMLPGSKTERVAGRFLESFGFLLLGGGVGTLIMVIVGGIQGKITEGLEIVVPIAFGVGLIMIALQNVLLYAIGKGKSHQVIGIVRMVPGFAGFFAGMAILDEIQENPLQYANLWIFSHPQESALLVLLIGVIIYLLAIMISTAIIKKRDFN
ncbi:MAG: ABC-2 transporter permease [Roseburia sp.]